jgi:hypothetical protein
VSPVRYELGFYIPEDDILHSRCFTAVTTNLTLVVCSIGGVNEKRRQTSPHTKERYALDATFRHYVNESHNTQVTVSSGGSVKSVKWPRYEAV